MEITGHKRDVMFIRYLMTNAQTEAETLERTFAYLDRQNWKRMVVPMSQ